MMTCNILVLFASDSEKLAMDFIDQFDHVPINYICVNHSLQLSTIKEKAIAKIHVIFFSPKFLTFVENKVVLAYYMCGHLESQSALAVFCPGLKMEDVKCYHMAPLKSFLSWTKYELLSTSDKDHLFPEELLNRIHELIRSVNIATEDIVVVPQLLKRHNNTVYGIFTRPLKQYKDLRIYLNEHEDIDISLSELNPYVMKFSIPDSLFQFSHNVIVRIQCGDEIITNQVVHLSQETPENAHVNRKESRKSVTRKQISGINPDDPLNVNLENETFSAYQLPVDIQEAVKVDLKKLCRQYGLERLSLLINDDSLDSKNEDDECPIRENPFRKKSNEVDRRQDLRHVNDLQEMDLSNRMNSFLVQEADQHGDVPKCRSLSLPPTLIPSLDASSSYGGYLEMGGKEPPELKPHEKLLAELRCRDLMGRRESTDVENLHKELMNSISSDHYMTLTTSDEEQADTRAQLKKGLSRSQQELLDILQDFKKGECTMSFVEDRFQLWREKHCPKAQKPVVHTSKKTPFMRWKRPKKKRSKVNGENKQNVKAAKQEEKCSSRKASNASASSTSSKASEKGWRLISSTEGSTVSEHRHENGNVPTRWFSDCSPTRNRDFTSRYPSASPPPLPSRRPPWSKMATVNQPTSLKNSSTDITHMIEEEKSPDVIKNLGEAIEEHKRNSSIYELCQKYGLEKLGVFFVSGEGRPSDDRDAQQPEEMARINKNNVLPSGSPDFQGYEIPIKRKLEKFSDSTTHKILRRSASLPSDLSAYELPDNLLDSAAPSVPLQSDEPTRTCICDHCSKDHDCFTDNFYMSLLEFRRDNPTDEEVPLRKSFLSKSQQELINIMYAFKRGERTISQVEHQCQDWHRVHVVQPCKKLPKQSSSFGLPGFMKILGISKKKTSVENKFDCDPERRNVKNSEAVSPNQKRLSLLSGISTSSANSEVSNVSKTRKGSRKGSMVVSDVTPFAFNKLFHPPPLPPKRPSLMKELSRSAEMGQAQTPPTLTTDPTRRQKPTFIPKPEFRLTLVSGSCSSKATVSTHEQCINTEFERETTEDESETRPSSPIYVDPDVQERSDRSKLKRHPRVMSWPRKWFESQKSERPVTPTIFSRSRQFTEPGSQTLELLQRANLVSPDPNILYARSISDPNVRHVQSEEKQQPPAVPDRPQPIYLEILPLLERNLPKESRPVNQADIAC